MGASIREILERTRSIAVVGASPDPWRPSFGVSAYLLRAGYRVVPVNPTALGAALYGRPFVASLREAGPVDLVDVFRRPEAVPEVVEEALALAIPALWLQLGLRHPGARARAEAAGIDYVEDRCISVEHARMVRG